MKVERLRCPEGTLIRLAGAIDERFPPVFDDAAGVIAVDMAGVTRVTSFGIREWRQAVTALQAQSLYFVNVPPAVMAQFGMVAGFGGPRGQILSYSAPYRCASCGAETYRLFDRRSESDMAGMTNPPTLACSGCGGVMEFDDLPEYYQEALAGTAPLRIVPALFTVLAAGDAARRPLKITKAVDGSATILWLSGALDGRANFRHVADGLEGDVVVVPAYVSACDEAGLRALGRLVAQTGDAGCAVWVARIPVSVQEVLGRVPGALGGARLVSVELEATCKACERELPSLAVATAAGEVGLFCPRCDGRLAPPGADAALRALAAAELAPIPDWLPPLLESRPGSTPTSQSGPFADKYTLLKLLGAGGMAEIYLARQRGPAGFDRRVAIKRILPHLAREPSFIQMFLHEARLAARLSHPNIVQIHELLDAEGQYYIVMECVDGHDLGTLLAAARQSSQLMPVECALQIVGSMCAGLHAAHTAVDDEGTPLRIVHRDVSPQNVLIGRDGSVKLTDFGVAKAADQLDQTRPGVVKGKISYLSPEAFTLGEPDHRTDIFAAGIVLFECLVGFHPFRRASDYQTTQAVLSDPLPSVKGIRPEVSTDLDAILARATARKREDRYQTAEEMMIDLGQLLADSGTPHSPRTVANWVASLKPAMLQVEITDVDEQPTVATVAGKVPPERT